ncbi:Gfo/Idh/MocA family protein [Cohnella luojiensis]|uniref:Gfo/Idh/MocA family oxidoreductase n=1 Tax=Cohnella luojiensis TaxID=652876 RepID=A0A4Y8LX17_9BACL|nr:Gfo/Idh/MocA family oxidoreductase [Cohnella luojiensis]TFE25830.1 Gfo/Idh/MocA family oxidoreductase [Cohnella luojiensis]
MIRFGIIGTNWITEDFINAARRIGDFALTAVYSRSEATGRQFADKHGIPHVYADLESFAASSELDAVYIASPNSFHAEQAILLMNHGKHVLCEKPLASNALEVRRMTESAANNQVVLMEAMKSTFTPNFLAIRDNLHKIGTVRRYFASYCQYSSRYDLYKRGEIPNAFNPEFSNGALMDLGVYCVYPLVVLFGLPDSIQANGFMLDSGVDGAGSILLSYKGMDAVIHYSKIVDSYASAEIQGENGTIIFDKISRPDKVQIRYRDGTLEDLTQAQEDNAMFYEVQEFIALIQRGAKQSSVNSHVNSLAVIGILDEARKQMGLVYPADGANS